MPINKKAVSYILVASFAFSVMNVLIKQVSYFPTFQLIFFRSFGTLLLVFIMLKKKKIPVLGSRRPILFLRAITGVISLALYFWALKSIPVGTATSLRYMSPIFASILAVIILKEKIKPLQWILFALAFLGVLIIKGFHLEVNTLGLMAVLLSALFVGLVFVLIRKIGSSDHYLVIIFYFMFAAFCISGILTMFNYQHPIGMEWVYLFASGIAGFIGQITMTQALQMEETSTIVPFKYSEIIFIPFAGWILFGETQNTFTILGTLCIITAVLGNTFIKMKKN